MMKMSVDEYDDDDESADYDYDEYECVEDDDVLQMK